MYLERKITSVRILTLLAFLVGAVFVFRTHGVVALTGQLGVEQITLNPGGGVQPNGSDGMRFTINATANGGWPGADYVGNAGQDAVAYRNTVQYCCSAGAPMLNVGGTLFGQAGPASYQGQNWSSLEILATGGATAVGSRTASVGNSSATIRYTAQKNGLTYQVTRTITYTYPNDYITDSYTFSIPEGNSEAVKFYLGGDTAPGSSDVGYGIMLTDPVRAVISLNTSSEIMFGFREISGSKPFDGATSQGFSTPYATVNSGGNIGFVGTASNHDAGLMMQWNLGSSPGLQTASLQQFATQQGTNLNAVFASNTADINEPVQLSISIVNTELTQIDELGYTLTLPTGLVIGGGSNSNTCDGLLSAATGSNTITLSNALVNSGSNCVVSVPVLSSDAGTFALSSSSFTNLQGSLTNNVGSFSLLVTNPELGDDLNGDGIEDSLQSNVYSYTNALTGETVVLEVDSSCSVSSALSIEDTESGVVDSGYEYINGLMNFTANCGSAGYSTTVKQYYYNVENNLFVLRKFNPNTNVYFSIEGAEISEQTINGRIVTTAEYEVTDGGELDIDEEENGIIVDPAGLAGQQSTEPTPGAEEGPNSGLASTGELQIKALVGAGLLCIVALLFISKYKLSTSRV